MTEATFVFNKRQHHSKHFNQKLLTDLWVIHQPPSTIGKLSLLLHEAEKQNKFLNSYLS